MTMTTDRIKDINKFIDNILSQDEWEYNYNKRLDDLITKYSSQLEKYNYIIKDEIDSLIIGGYIKYIDINNNLNWGGVLAKIDSNYIYLKKYNEYIKINKFKNIIFYRNHRTKNDKYREIFVTGLDMYG
jgi:hypothetical protein